tara:strand:+ start:674 stop:979 length:306 start_codon:yes stop_codon:yes gene_type:complete
MGNLFSQIDLFRNNPRPTSLFGKKKPKLHPRVFPLGVISPLYSHEQMNNPELLNQDSVFPTYNDNISPLSIEYTANINNSNKTVRDSSVYIVGNTATSSRC